MPEVVVVSSYFVVASLVPTQFYANAFLSVYRSYALLLSYYDEFVLAERAGESCVSEIKSANYEAAMIVTRVR
jgi:hypothetical protein